MRFLTVYCYLWVAGDLLLKARVDGVGGLAIKATVDFLLALILIYCAYRVLLKGVL